MKSSPASSNGAAQHWTLVVVFLSLLIDLLGFTVILPLIPSMLEYYSKADQVSTCSFMMMSCCAEKVWNITIADFLLWRFCFTPSSFLTF